MSDPRGKPGSAAEAELRGFAHHSEKIVGRPIPAEAFLESGFPTIDSIAAAEIGGLQKLKGVGPTRAARLIAAARLVVTSREQDRRDALQDWAEAMRRDFEETGDPLLAWHVDRAYEERGEPQPAWVRDYWRGVRDQGLDMETTWPDGDVKALERDLARLTGARSEPGTRSPRERRSKLQRDRLLGRLVYNRQWEPAWKAARARLGGDLSPLDPGDLTEEELRFSLSATEAAERVREELKEARPDVDLDAAGLTVDRIRKTVTVYRKSRGLGPDQVSRPRRRT